MYLIDTNVLLDFPSVLSRYRDNILLSIRVIEELDNLKNSLNPELAYKARRATYLISQEKNISFDFETYQGCYTDNALLEILQKREGLILITNDLNLLLKCEACHLKGSLYKEIDTDYTGISYLIEECDDNLYSESLDKILAARVAPMPMKENEFLIIKQSGANEVLSTLRLKKGKLELLRDTFIQTKFDHTILPRNIEQHCLMSLLDDPEVSIIAATGEYGTGKSYLLTSYALQELEKGHINKIVYVPNNSTVEHSRELGLLPGDTIDKELAYMGPILDLIGGAYAREMSVRGDIEVVPLAVMRGRSFTKAIVIVNEAQNLTMEHIKLLIARCGEGTRIFFDGDIKQTDSSVFKNKNGLKGLLKLADSKEFSPLFGTVRLNSIERSKTAQASSYLDKLFI